jgi:tRNA pseudouridine38-40 synthase
MDDRLRNIRLVLAYDGTNYNGWQRQAAGTTLQGLLEEKIRMMVDEPVSLIASGRTDAGVHALEQVCNFKTRTALDCGIIRKGLNAVLPRDVFIRAVEEAPLDFHARYHARSKLYEYRILNRAERDPFGRHYHWHIPHPLDQGAMRECLAMITGMHDFSAFRSSGSRNVNPVRTVLRAGLTGPECGLLRIEMQADGFLRHMVRNIVGTMVAVGLGRMDPEGFRTVLASGDRQRAGLKAPPQGLFLMRVFY